MRHMATWLGLLIVFTATNVWAQPSQVCPLLSASDVISVGATGQGIPGEMPLTGGPKGDTMKLCSWRMAMGGMHLSVAKAPPRVTRGLHGQAQRDLCDPQSPRLDGRKKGLRTRIL